MANAQTWTYGILGPIELRRDGRGLPLGGPRQAALLAFLLMHANRGVSSDALADAVWSGDGFSAGSKRLQMAVTRLRRALDPDGEAACSQLRTIAGGYVLVVAPGELDAAIFEARVEEGDRALEEGHTADAAAILREALKLWRGAPMTDLGYVAFAQIEIRRLEELHLHALEARVEADLQLGRHAELVGELEALVAAHPARERTVAHLMTALYRCGRQADALDVYRRTRAYLADELGLEPRAELKNLQSQILAQSVALDATIPAKPPRGITGPALPALVARLGQQRLLGRDRELGRIESCWRSTLTSASHRILLVGGEAGVGKTSLVTHFGWRVSAGGATVLYGRADAEALVPYQPFVEALRHLALRAPLNLLEQAAPDDLAEISRLVPEFRRRHPDLSAPLGYVAGDDRYRLFSAAAAVLIAAAARAPLLLVLDDLHWADRSSLRLMCHLARYSEPAPLLVLGTYRDSELQRAHELEDALVDLRREHLDERLALAGLDEQAVSELVAETRLSAPAGLSSILHQQTRGNPFFLVEMLRHLGDSAGFESSRKLPAGTELLAATGVPDGVRQVIDHRLTGLGEVVREVLTTASVLGQEFEAAPLAAVTGHAPEGLEAPLEAALKAGIVVEVAGVRGRFGFSHALVRDALYAGLSEMRRATLHRRVADALELLFGAEAGDLPAAELAHHLMAGGARADLERAARYSVLAAEQATARLAYEEAAAHYARALESAARRWAQPDRRQDEQRCDILLALGEASWCCGELGKAREACLAAADVARRLGDPQRLARAALGYAGPLRFEPAARRSQPVVQLLEDALDASDDADSVLRARVLARLAAVLLSGGDERRKHVLAEDAVALARRVGDEAGLAEVLAACLFATRGPDNLEQRLATGQELARLAGRVGEGRLEAVTRGGLLDDLLEFGDVKASDRELDSFDRVAQALGERYRRWLVAVAQARQALLRGRLEDSDRLAQYAVTLGLGETDESAFMAYAAHILFVRREQGRLAELVEGVEMTARQYPEVPAWRCGLAYVYAQLDRPAAAREQLDVLGAEGFEDLPRDSWWLVGMSMLADVAGFVDARDHAEQLYDLFAPFADRCVVATISCQGSASRPLGVLATTLSRFDAAAAHFDSALAVNERLGSPLWVAHTQVDYARMLLRRDDAGDRGRVLELLDSARSIAGAHALTAVAERVTGVAQAASA